MNIFEDNNHIYQTIHIGWGYVTNTELTLHDRTLKEAYTIAILMGLKPRRWYNPLSWFSGLWVVTVG